jgi:hypothetical protein
MSDNDTELMKFMIQLNTLSILTLDFFNRDMVGSDVTDQQLDSNKWYNPAILTTRIKNIAIATGAGNLSGLLNPHTFFLQFLCGCGYDAGVLIDLLIDEETVFLEFLVSHYFKYAPLSPEQLIASAQWVGQNCANFMSALADKGDVEEQGVDILEDINAEYQTGLTILEQFKECMGSLWAKLSELESKRLFPYPVGPLIDQLETFIMFLNDIISKMGGLQEEEEEDDDDDELSE